MTRGSMGSRKSVASTRKTHLPALHPFPPAFKADLPAIQLNSHACKLVAHPFKLVATTLKNISLPFEFVAVVIQALECLQKLVSRMLKGPA